MAQQSWEQVSQGPGRGARGQFNSIALQMSLLFTTFFKYPNLCFKQELQLL